MKGAVHRNVSFLAARFLLSSAKFDTFSFNSLTKQFPLSSLINLTRSHQRFCSSHFHPNKEEDDDNEHDDRDDNDDVSKKELKLRIQKFLDGDEEAIPSIFEGILRRKLSGKHEESDDELMNEIRCGRKNQPLHHSSEQDPEFDSDLSDSSDTDRE